MKRLFVEIRRNILEHLEVQDVAALRLVSKAWGSLGYEYLIPTSYLAHNHPVDMYRLYATSEDPRLAFRVKSLSIFLGELERDQGSSKPIPLNSMFRYSSESGTFVSDLERCLEDFRLGVLFWRDAFQLSSLTKAFGSLPSLKHISINIIERPYRPSFFLDLRHPTWVNPGSRMQLRQPVATNFTDLLTAIAHCPSLSLESLSHDWVPFEFFSQPGTSICRLSSSFPSLSALTLTIGDTDFGDSQVRADAFTQLAHALANAHNLHKLSLAFEGKLKTDIAPLLAAFATLDVTFRALESLTLENVAVSESELATFLVRHRQLKSVVLGGPGTLGPAARATGGVQLLEWTFEGLVEKVRAEGTVEKFQVMGDMNEISSGRTTFCAELQDIGPLCERPRSPWRPTLRTWRCALRQEASG
jgi:hypothetical protein